MSDDDFVIECRDRLVIGYFVGRNWYHERRDTRSIVPSSARRYGCGVYSNGTREGYQAARRRVLDCLKATAHILETGEYRVGSELAAEWPAWTHVCLLEGDKYREGHIDGDLP